MPDNEVKKWKKISYIEADIVVEDWFYAKTPDLRDSENYAFSPKAKFKFSSVATKHSTIEQINPNEDKNEEISKEVNEPPKVQENNK